MSATPFDSALYRDLFNDPDTAKLFSDTAEIRAMLITWGALALAQAKHGLIPETAAHAIQKAAMEIQIDPGALTAETGQNAVPIPALAKAFRDEMKAPEHADYVHFGATSQDIMDTALSLRLRQVLALFGTRLDTITRQLGTLARDHAETPMAGRTWGQVATPTSFGAVVASWGAPLLSLQEQMQTLREQTLWVSLSGAGGTLAPLHPKGAEVRADLAKGLGLHDPGRSWHSTRNGRAGLAAWLTQTITQLGKMAADVAQMASTAQGELTLDSTGGSSTMPQKQNPVQAALLQSLALHATGLNTTLQSAAMHREQRDGAAWMAEWLALPQLCCAAGRALATAESLTASIRPNTARMAANIDDGTGLIYAEALSFHLAGSLPRPEAQKIVKDLCAKAMETSTPLQRLATEAYPDMDLSSVFTPNLGHAPDDARAFAKAAL